MNAFENIVTQYLEETGHWVRQSVKVDISLEDKCKIGPRSMPRPEIDLVALNVEENELLLIEAKSFLDSRGVRFDGVSGKDARLARRYKLFTNENFRKIVTDKLREEYLKKGLIDENTKINYALAAGNIYADDESKISEYFEERGWKLFSPEKIKEQIAKLSKKGWEDNVVTMTAKLILRDEK